MKELVTTKTALQKTPEEILWTRQEVKHVQGPQGKVSDTGEDKGSATKLTTSEESMCVFQ